MSPDDQTRRIVHVVAAAVTDANGRVLIAQRPPGKYLAGSWEFPGGKLEPGEARVDALARELREELGIAIEQPRPLIRVRHAYPFGEVLIDMWVVRRYGGEPRGLDGQALRWCTQDELATAELLPADRPIVAALHLPERLREASSPYYTLGELNLLRRPVVGADAASHDSRLRGVFCANGEEGVAAAAGAAGDEGRAQAAADFLVLQRAIPAAELAALCDSVSVPVYARGESLEEAWGLGASGLNDLAV